MSAHAVDIAAPTRLGRFGRALRDVLATPQGVLGAVMIGVVVGVIAIGPFVTPYDPTAIGVGIPAQGPSTEHLLGTDALGRDVLSRFLTGGASVVAVPLAAVTLAFLVGGLAGLVFGYRGGFGDLAVTRVVDVLLPIPTLLVALLLIAQLGGSVGVLVIVVGAVFAPRVARVLRGAVQNVRSMEYVQAAEVRGERQRTVIFREVLPNMAGPALVEYGVRVNYAVVFVASLNFLGFAAQPPSSNWGLMIAEGRDIIAANPCAALVPAAAIGVLVVGINLLTDAATQHLSRELAPGRAG